MNNGSSYEYLQKANIQKKYVADNGEVGTYALVKQGCLTVQHPLKGPYPVVIPCPGVTLLINGRKCTQPTPISMKDTVKVETMEELREGEWSVKISPDGLQAILRIRPTVLLHRKLPDLPPARVLKLRVVEREEYYPPFTTDELMYELSRQGIKHGIDWKACYNSATSYSQNEVVIAQGIPAEQGEDGRVELLFASNPKIPVVPEEDETVDFWKRYVFTSVGAGEILAVKCPSKPGRYGISVKNEMILPPEPREFILSVGEGAVLIEDGQQAVAIQPGRPTVSYRGNCVKVSVLPELVHDGDVDLVSGNIAFKGDILITGNVTESMLVKSCGNIRIRGLVSGAKVQASESVSIMGNILSSVVMAGRDSSYIEKILPQLRTLIEGLKEMGSAIMQLLDCSEFKMQSLKGSIGPLVKLLLEEKFCYLIAAVKSLRNTIENMTQGLVDESLKEFIQRTERVLVSSSLTISSPQEIEILAKKARELEQNLAFSPPTEGSIVASSIQNSTVIATGDIKVAGSGCYISRIQAGKKVTIPGVVRGGEIYAGSDVFVGELGSKSGAATRIVADSAAVVTVGYAFENSTVSVGGQAYRFNRKEKNVRLWLDKEGKLKFNGIPI